MLYKMENNYETLRIPELKALDKEHGLRGYSRLTKTEFIELLQDKVQGSQQRPPEVRSACSTPPQMSTREPECEPEQELEAPLM